MEKDIKDLLESAKLTGEGWRANCPRCDDREQKFYFNTEKRVGCCFHADCPWHVDRGGATESRIRAFLGDFTPTKAPETLEVSEQADVKLPKEFELLEDIPPLGGGDAIYSYLEGRGLTHKILRLAKVGYCSIGRFWGYIIFPVFDNGEVVYWQGRRFKNREQKFYNPPSSRKADFLYNLHSSKQPKRIVLVESVINALTIESESRTRANCIFALLGKTLSDVQMHKILAYERHVQEIAIALDPDAWRNAVEMADKLFGTVPKVSLVKIPEGQDINSMGRQLAWEAIFDAVPYHRSRRLEILHGVRGE